MTKFDVFSEREFSNRHENIRNNIDPDFAIVFNRADLFYYSGTGFDGILTMHEGELKRYSRRNLDLASEESVLETEMMPSFRLFKDLGNDHEVEKLGLELDLLPYRTVKYIEKSFGDVQIVDIGNDLRKIRAVKSKEEQEYMKQAAKQTDESFRYISDKIKPGISELELSADIEYFLRREGHPGYVNVRMFHHNLTTLAYVMAGESTATLNSGFGPVSGQGLCKLHKNGPSKRKIRNDEAVLIDTTGVVEGYTADETRTIFVGSPDQKLYDAHNVAKAVQERTQDLLKHGAAPGKIYHELWELVEELGFSDNFMGIGSDIVPFIGHGIGLELDEFPIITPKYADKLETGNIVAMEPKLILNQPNTGVGIEDSWIVGENGAEKITQFPW